MEDKINTGLHLDERKCEGEQGKRNEETEGGRERKEGKTGKEERVEVETEGERSG